MRKRTLARECALQILYQMDVNHQTALEAMGDFWSVKNVEDSIRAFANALVEGVEEKKDSLDEEIAKIAQNWKLNRMAVVDRNILRLAAYELLYHADVPHKVSINEAIELAKKYGDSDSSRFVNGILDKIGKQKIH